MGNEQVSFACLRVAKPKQKRTYASEQLSARKGQEEKGTVWAEKLLVLFLLVTTLTHLTFLCSLLELCSLVFSIH